MVGDVDSKSTTIKTVSVIAAVHAAAFGALYLYKNYTSDKVEAGATGKTLKPQRFMKQLAESLLKTSSSKHTVFFPTVDKPILEEIGGLIVNSNTRQESKVRMFMQLLVLDASHAKMCRSGCEALKKACIELKVDCVIYEDVSNPKSLALLVWSTDPAEINKRVREVFCHDDEIDFVIRPNWIMFGKTYANGHEANLVDHLLKKPVRNAINEGNDWAIWYPMRRLGKFYLLPPEEKCRMLLVHAAIGRSYSELDAAHDIRLNCFGIDSSDNEFIVGLLGSELSPLSKVVEQMRKTEHTSSYLASLGPFFVGKRVFSLGSIP